MELNEKLVEDVVVQVGDKQLVLLEPTLATFKAVGVLLKPFGIRVTFGALQNFGSLLAQLFEAPIDEFGPDLVAILLDTTENRAAVGNVTSPAFRDWVLDHCGMGQAIDVLKALGKLPIFEPVVKSLGPPAPAQPTTPTEPAPTTEQP